MVGSDGVRSGAGSEAGYGVGSRVGSEGKVSGLNGAGGFCSTSTLSVLSALLHLLHILYLLHVCTYYSVLPILTVLTTLTRRAKLHRQQRHGSCHERRRVPSEKMEEELVVGCMGV